MPLSEGMEVRRPLKALRPPAEAPMPMTGKPVRRSFVFRDTDLGDAGPDFCLDEGLFLLVVFLLGLPFAARFFACPLIVVAI